MSYAQKLLQQMPSSIGHDPSLSRVAGMPAQRGQQLQMHGTNQPSAFDTCPNDLADPNVQKVLDNLPKLFEQNPQLMQQVKQQFDQPRFKFFNEFMGTVGVIFKNHQITDIDPLQLCLNAEYRETNVNEIAQRLPLEEQKSLLLATANLDNALKNPGTQQHVEAELKQLVNQAGEQILSKDPQGQQIMQQFEQQQTQAIQCKSRFVRGLQKTGDILANFIGLPVAAVLSLVWIIFGSPVVGLASVAPAIVLSILHLLCYALTLRSGQGIFAALTGTALRLIGAIFMFSWGTFAPFFWHESGKSMRQDARNYLNEIPLRWEARHEGRNYRQLKQSP